MAQGGVSDLFRNYHQELVRFASRLVGTRSGGEEVAQDAYLKLIGGNVQLASIASPKAYLFTAARHIAFDLRAKSSREWSHRVDVEDLSLLQDARPDPSVIIGQRQQLQMLADALNELPKACRTAFFLNRIEGLKHRTIAERLGVSVSMVEKHIVRAFIHCRERMGEENSF